MSAKQALFSMAAVLGIVFGPIAHAQEIKLRLADGMPVSLPHSKEGPQWFMNEVTKRSNGRVVFEHYPAEQLGKRQDMLELTQSGATDISEINPGAISSRFPLSSVAELPGTFTTSCEGVRAFAQLASEGGFLFENEIEPNGLLALFPTVGMPYTLWTSRKDVQKLDDISGLKLRATGSPQRLLVEKLGGVPVNISGGDTYDALSRGTIDGLIFPLNSLVSRDLARLLQYGLIDQNFGNSVTFFGMSKTKFDSLPEDVQALLREVGAETVSHLCESLQVEDQHLREVPEIANLNLIKLAPEVKAELDNIHAEVAQAWAAENDGRGLAGSEALEAFREALAP